MSDETKRDVSDVNPLFFQCSWYVPIKFHYDVHDKNWIFVMRQEISIEIRETSEPRSFEIFRKRNSNITDTQKLLVAVIFFKSAIWEITDGFS